MGDPVQDHYSVLRITPDAPSSVIRAAVKALRLEHHPDRNPGDTTAHELTVAINQAAEVLLDPDRRAAYDRGRVEAVPDRFVLDVTDASFEADVLVQSLTVPVVIDFWAEWCGPCKQLSPVLERLAAEYAGRFVLARIDVDGNQRIAAATQVQSIPMVIGVIVGMVVPLFSGASPEPQVRQYLDELLRVAAQYGVSGTA